MELNYHSIEALLNAAKENNCRLSLTNLKIKKEMKNKFRQNIVIGVIAIDGTMGYNLSINQENENVRLITGNIEALAEEEGGLDCNYNRHPSQ